MYAYAPVVERLKLPTGALIDGTFHPAASGRTFETRNPCTGQVTATLPACGAEDVDAGWMGIHPEIAPPSNIHHFRDTTGIGIFKESSDIHRPCDLRHERFRGQLLQRPVRDCEAALIRIYAAARHP